MRFNVVGANMETGDDVDVTVDAADKAEVERIAHDKGILVSAIKTVEEAAASSEDTAIALVVDDTPTTPHISGAVGSSHAPAADHAHTPGHAPAHADHGHGPEHHKSGITLSANAPSEAGHTADDKSHSGHADQKMEYHLLQNQALYLLEVAVNKYIRDGWEPQGGLTIGVSNNAMNYFQAIVRRKK